MTGRAGARLLVWPARARERVNWNAVVVIVAVVVLDVVVWWGDREGTVLAGGGLRMDAFVIVRKPVLMEDEGRFMVEAVRYSEEEAQRYIQETCERGGNYFHPKDYEVQRVKDVRG